MLNVSPWWAVYSAEAQLGNDLVQRGQQRLVGGGVAEEAEARDWVAG